MGKDHTKRLRELEESLWRAETRFDVAHMEAVIAPDCVEFGSSGKIYTRRQIVETPPTELRARLPLEGFAVRLVATDLALVTYRSAYLDPFAEANRSSLWRRTGDDWQLVFHQGTLLPGRSGET
jgi:hypothetical protein